ncbi:DNA alkylation repair protein [Rhodovulum sp. DZ06]|uniref:DNA alkylation repair protein n=1 Tax=Rhodovulum sp. DZ06 TaxID=3425126 RepID=UPI003D33AF20
MSRGKDERPRAGRKGGAGGNADGAPARAPGKGLGKGPFNDPVKGRGKGRRGARGKGWDDAAPAGAPIDPAFADDDAPRIDSPGTAPDAAEAPRKPARKPGWAKPGRLRARARAQRRDAAAAQGAERAAGTDAAPQAQPQGDFLPVPIPPRPAATRAGEAALEQIRARALPGKGAEMARYHKTGRLCLGVANPDLDELARDWRARIEAEAEAAGRPALPDRLALAADLWDTGVFEARIAAAKLLTQARIRDDGDAWALILGWVPEFDGWAIADAVAGAAQRRLAADPSRIEALAPLVGSDHLWSRRAALVFTLPFAKTRHPGAGEAAARDLALGWAASMAPDPEWFIQKAVGWWLRTLSAHDPERVRAFIDAHGDAMKPFAVKEALRKLD